MILTRDNHARIFLEFCRIVQRLGEHSCHKRRAALVQICDPEADDGWREEAGLTIVLNVANLTHAAAVAVLEREYRKYLQPPPSPERV